SCPALRQQKVSPHVLRRSTAMRLLNAGVDTAVIALWMGRENAATTQVYIHADLALKERAIARTAPKTLRLAGTSHPGRWPRRCSAGTAGPPSGPAIQRAEPVDGGRRQQVRDGQVKGRP